ncbi:gliding motility protein GldN [Mucilaginibacter sp.]|jgi:gliding motility associated protien GldN|uniref:type IX secretion system ring protein PorN/GldN n=1 Tax=Mucilaginibacter sp. TaxID=1882438 RepID=UPI003567F6D2
MKNLLFVIALFMVTGAFGQKLTGKWLGELPQGDKSVHFRIELDLKQTGNQITGTSSFRTLDNHAVSFLVSGSINGNDVILNEYKTINCDCNNQYIFCMKRMKGKFMVDSLNSLYAISGIWTSDSSYNGTSYIKSDCAPGTFAIVKPVELRPLDGYYRKTDIKNARSTPYANLREGDVSFSKRVWRDFDVRDKANRYMASPKQRLIDVLMDAVKAGEITAYDAVATKDDPGGDSFSRRLTPDQAMSKMADSSVVDKFDKDGNKIGSALKPGEFNPDSIVKFRIKEDWMYDRQRSVFEPRIIGIAPLIKPKAAGLNLDYQPAFWIHFPEARRILANKEAVNRNNDATSLSYDDIFMKRLFSSYIIKESNDKDERIRDFAQGLDKLRESEKIKKALAEWELQLWKNTH